MVPSKDLLAKVAPRSGIASRKCSGRELLNPGVLHAPEQRFNLRHLIGPYAQAVDTQTNENRRCNRIGSRIAANSNVSTSCLCTLDHDLNPPQNCWMQGTLQSGKLAVAALRCEDILRQVVRPDAEKLRHFSQLLGHERGSRHLDHHANLHGPDMRLV